MWPAVHFFNLVCALPFLEDLDVGGHRIGVNDDNSAVFQSLTSPPLTGTLGLYLTLGIKTFTRLLLQLPNGIRFRKLECAWTCPHDVRYTADLVEACSDALQCISIDCKNPGEFNPSFLLWTGSRLTFTSGPESLLEGSIDFSNAIKLEEIAFCIRSLGNVWTTLAFKTLTSKHKDLRQISIGIPVHLPDSFMQMGEKTHRQWADFDHLLVKLWESNAIHIRVVCIMERGRAEVCERIERLLPEVTKRMIFELVDNICVS